MISRRLFLGTSAVGILLSPSVVRAQIGKNPFTLGVASGTPREESVILWTRLAPEPLRFNSRSFIPALSSMASASTTTTAAA